MNKDNKLDKILDFAKIAEKLKLVKRYGATPEMKIKESSADHSWKVALLAFVLAEELELEIDLLKAIKMALIHDIIEAICGDVDHRLIYLGKVSKEEKEHKEQEAMKEITKILPSKTGSEINKLWQEYEESKSPEAKFIRAIDKMEAIDHLVYKGHENYDIPEKIATYADNAVSNYPDLINLLRILKQQLKEEYSKGSFPWKNEYDRV